MAATQQDLVFTGPGEAIAPPVSEGAGSSGESPWKIMVIDDDPDLHPLTRLVLREMVFEGRSMRFIDGYSGADARRLMGLHPDTAVILLDVVMETDKEGLNVVRYIRDELKNPFVRIILRTGQPGQAPEAEVIANYDINDYKDKVNLSNQALITSVTASLRAFNLLNTIENTRQGLRRIIEATGRLYELNSLGQLATSMLTQLAALLGHGGEGGGTGGVEGFAATEKRGTINIYAAIGQYEAAIGQAVFEVVPPSVAERVRSALLSRRSLFGEYEFLGYFRSRRGMENLIHLKCDRRLRPVDRDLIEVFSSNIATAFEQLLLNREMIKTQKDVTFTLGEIIETRSGEAGQHVRRVAENSRLLAQLAGLSEPDCELLRMASPMHDLGKIGIPDAILNKPGKLTPEEWRIMQSHTEIGCQVLKSTDQRIIRTGAVICGQHHEKWDGTGYPQGLKGEEIHIFARITSLIDVFDALTHKRSYKEAWTLEQTLELIKRDRGTHFDPGLVDLFLDNIDSFLEIQKAFA
ncbi:MAG: DUF3369 domain-containing protein [Magnetococcales bacterium]|nr:DUF3369 domain-containing protein [Magnetococcales bacterium]